MSVLIYSASRADLLPGLARTVMLVGATQGDIPALLNVRTLIDTF
jgi:hypothetical protein